MRCRCAPTRELCVRVLWVISRGDDGVVESRPCSAVLTTWRKRQPFARGLHVIASFFGKKDTVRLASERLGFVCRPELQVELAALSTWLLV